jgi:hypothetical protein
VGESSAYTIPPGQRYAVTTAAAEAVYYHSGTFDGTAPGDRTVIRSADVFYQIQAAHRVLFVKADDVDVEGAFSETF